jgi:hypothetical protein
MKRLNTKHKKVQKSSDFYMSRNFYPEFFPALFLMLGLYIGTINAFLKDSWVSWVVMGVGIILYWLLLKWFYYELRGSQK